MSYQQEKFREIADAIREKTGSEDLIKPSDFAEKIGEVYEAGKQKNSNDEFWDNFQNFGTRSRYDTAFEYWAGEYLRPKYKIVPTSVFSSSTYGFYRFLMSSNIRVVEKKYVDLSQLNLPTGAEQAGWRQTFQSCSNLEIVEDIGMQAATYYYTFTNCNNLRTIEVLRFAEDTKALSAFNSCISLQNINNIEGVIGQNISFKNSPLSVASCIRVITHLKDYAGTSTAGARTLTLSTESKNLLNSQGEIAELGGKTYDTYIADKGWNLA